jgi:hypothetical protein
VGVRADIVIGDVERRRGGAADPFGVLGFERIDEFPAVFLGDEGEEVKNGVVVVGVWEDDFVGPFVGEVVGVVLRQIGFLVYGGVVECGAKCDWKEKKASFFLSSIRVRREGTGDVRIKYPAYAPSLSTNSGCTSLELAGL